MIGYYLELHKFLMLVARTSDLELLITRDPPPFPSTRLHCKESLMSGTFDNQGETPWNPPVPSARLQCKEDFIHRTFNNQGGTLEPPFPVNTPSL